MAVDETLQQYQILETAPPGTDKVKDGAAIFRQRLKASNKLVKTAHNKLGQHLYAVDSGALNAYVGDVGSADFLAVLGLYAGASLYFKAATSNTGAATFKVQVNAADLGVATAIKLNGAALVGGEILAGTVIKLLWDGTAWALVGGNSVTAATAAAIIAALPAVGSTATLLYFNQTLAQINAFTVETAIASYTPAANTLTSLLFRVDFQMSNTGGNNRTFTPRFKQDAALIKQVATVDIDPSREPFYSMAAVFPGGQNGANVLKLTLEPSAALNTAPTLLTVWAIK